MFSLLVKLSPVLKLNVLSVSCTAPKVYLNLSLLPEVCRVLVTLILLKQAVCHWVLEILQLITQWCSLMANELRFSLYPSRREENFSIYPKFFAPLVFKLESINLGVHFPYWRHSDCFSKMAWYLTLAFSTDCRKFCFIEVVLPLLFIYQATINTRNLYFFPKF